MNAHDRALMNANAAEQAMTVARWHKATKKFNVALQQQQAQYNQAIATSNAQVQSLVTAHNQLITEMNKRANDYNSLREHSLELLEEYKKQAGVISGLSKMANGLGEELEKTQTQYKDLKTLCDRTIHATEATSTDIGKLNKELVESKIREKKLEDQCENLLSEVKDLHALIDSSSEEKLKVIQEQSLQIALLSNVINQIFQKMKESDNKP